MKALSLLQPWASLVVLGAKRFELRNWKTLHRGPLLIHASQRKVHRSDRAFFREADHFRHFISDTDTLPYGAIIGKVNLVDIVSTDEVIHHPALFPGIHWPQEFAFDSWGPGRWAWQFEEAESFDEPIPAKGSLMLWEFKGM